jgi:hypothetical protein
MIIACRNPTSLILFYNAYKQQVWSLQNCSRPSRIINTKLNSSATLVQCIMLSGVQPKQCIANIFLQNLIHTAWAWGRYSQNIVVPQHLQTHFWHCNMLLRYCDIARPFLSQNFQDFPRAMSVVPEVCTRSQNISHTYVSACHTYVSTSTNHGKLQLIIDLTQSSVSFN